MAKEKTPDRLGAPADPPSEVQITVMVVPRSRGRRVRERLAGIVVVASARTMVALALGVAVLGAISAGAHRGDRTAVPDDARAAQAHGVEPARVAAAYGYPLGCLNITISASNPAYAHADVDHRSVCGRYHGYVNASFHRIDGVWRLVLDEGQLFVSNGLLGRCRAARTGCPPAQGGRSPRR